MGLLPRLQIRVFVPFMTLLFPQTIPLHLWLSCSQAFLRDGLSFGPYQLHQHFEDGGEMVSLKSNKFSRIKTISFKTKWFKTNQTTKQKTQIYFNKECPFDNLKKKLIFHCKKNYLFISALTTTTTTK